MLDINLSLKTKAVSFNNGINCSYVRYKPKDKHYTTILPKVLIIAMLDINFLSGFLIVFGAKY